MYHEWGNFQKEHIKVEWKRVLRTEAILSRSLFNYHFYVFYNWSRNLEIIQKRREWLKIEKRKEEKNIKFRKIGLLWLERGTWGVMPENSTSEKILIQHLLSTY